MIDGNIRCTQCGVVLVDKRRKRIRSCAHNPLVIEDMGGLSRMAHIGLGTTKSGKYRDAGDTCFNDCFEKAFTEWRVD